MAVRGENRRERSRNQWGKNNGVNYDRSVRHPRYYRDSDLNMTSKPTRTEENRSEVLIRDDRLMDPGNEDAWTHTPEDIKKRSRFYAKDSFERDIWDFDDYYDGQESSINMDERIYQKACQYLYEHEDFDPTKIKIYVERGVVYLRGTVENRQIKKELEKVVESIPGVVDVLDELRLRRLKAV